MQSDLRLFKDHNRICDFVSHSEYKEITRLRLNSPKVSNSLKAHGFFLLKNSSLIAALEQPNKIELCGRRSPFDLAAGVSISQLFPRSKRTERATLCA